VREREVEASWRSWNGGHQEQLRLGWEGGGWTADGVISGCAEGSASRAVHYAIRVDDTWTLRQFLLFRDSDEPDLWLAHDGAGKWGEVNGAERFDLEGCTDIDLGCTPFTNTLPIRRLGLAVGESAEITAAWVDVETLLVVASPQRYTRLEERRWRFEALSSGFVAELEVDEHGLVLDYPDLFRRVLA
jgi:hypothetical protein